MIHAAEALSPARTTEPLAKPAGGQVLDGARAASLGECVDDRYDAACVVEGVVVLADSGAKGLSDEWQAVGGDGQGSPSHDH